MARPSKRDGWKLVGGRWTRSIGERGYRVRLFQKRTGGTFYRAVWVSGEGSDVKCLHTADREQAEQLGRRLVAAMMSGDRSQTPGGRIPLSELWDRYSRENPEFLDNDPKTQKGALSHARNLIGFYGPEFDVRYMTANDQAAYVQRRLAGGIRRPDGVLTAPSKIRSPEADIITLRAMLNWATTVRIGGERWLAYNPLEGIRRPREKNPRRPTATWERYAATRRALQDLTAAATSEVERTRWIKMELALVLAEATGRRLGSIRQLRWEDVDMARGTIRWRAEADKKRKEWTVPVPAPLLEELRQARIKLGAVGGGVFEAERIPDQPMDRHLFDKWLHVAEKHAGLEKLAGGLWHPYRRKWATERKHHPLKDVAAAGGWTDTETLLNCYQQADPGTMLAVMSEPQKVRELVAQR